jgi:hypothetical protein
MNALAGKLVWIVIAVIGAMCLGVIALQRGESINAIWLVVAALCVFSIGYRFYSKFIADKVLRLDPTRATPAVLRNDGLDYVPTDKWIVYGHHFAAIAGAGPLVGPVLAAQMGYLPGTMWILFGVVFAGAVQDFMVLGLSLRRDGRSLGHMLRAELGNVAGVICMIGVLALMMIVLAVLALVVSRRSQSARGEHSRSPARFRSRCSWASTCVSSDPGACSKCRSSAWCCCSCRSGTAARYRSIRTWQSTSRSAPASSPGC